MLIETMKTKKQNKIQKKSIEIIEYNDDNWEIIGSGGNLHLNKENIDEAFIAWRTGKLKEECSIKLHPPKILKN